MCTGMEIAMIASTAVSTLSGMAAAKQEEKAMRAQAEAARLKGIEDAKRARADAERLKGEQIAAFSKGGVAMEGSAEAVLADTAAQAELEALSIIHGGNAQANSFNASADSARARGRSALISGVGSIAGTALGSKSSGNPLRKGAPVVDLGVPAKR